jgi:hypothetical protein
VTALQFPTSLEGRAELSAEARRAELESWRASLAAPGALARFEQACRRATMAEASAEHLRRDELAQALIECRQQLADAQFGLAAAESVLREIGKTRTWRARGQLLRLRVVRALARATARDKGA